MLILTQIVILGILRLYFSVVNTVKRAFLIWLSIILFGNEVTMLSGLGTVIVIIGVTLYNKAQEYDKFYKASRVSTSIKSYTYIDLCTALG